MNHCLKLQIIILAITLGEHWMDLFSTSVCFQLPLFSDSLGLSCRFNETHLKCRFNPEGTLSVSIDKPLIKPWGKAAC